MEDNSMEQVIIRKEMKRKKELNDALEANIQVAKSGDEAETLFMVEEIEAV